MKKKIKLIALMALALSTFLLEGCSYTRVEPNYAGVLMENYGKAGKSDNLS